jgi:hypothetical protein
MRLIFILALQLLLLSCEVSVKTLQNPTVDISTFESWCWMEGCEIYKGPEYYKNEEAMNEIANAIAANMAEKGYVQTGGNSDLITNFYLILQEDSTEVSNDYQFADDFNRNWLNETYPEYRRFLKGTLVIDIINRQSSELIWTTKAIKYIEPSPTIDKTAIRSGVSKAMAKLPVSQRIKK